jgi:outer membrane receptor protein involved in Fe transport
VNTAKSRVWSRVFGSLFWLASSAAILAEASEVAGTVKDGTGGALVGARIVILTPQRAVVATTSTDQGGRYRVTNLPDGPYLVIAQYPSLAEKQQAVTIVGGKPVTLDLVLELSTVQQDVTVTASPGALGDIGTATQPINVISADDILQRAKTVVAQAVEGETAVNLQRTSPGMAGIFVRGLTGNKVNVFVDGVRYSNGAQRGGVNTFLDMIDPGTLEGIEVLRGPSSAQYGSDALGGSIQFLTHASPFSSTSEPNISGSLTVGGETGHRGGLGAGSLTYARTKFGVTGSFSGRKTGDYRPGTGEDSHAATVRFLGLPTSQFLDSHMPDTGFHQTGIQVRTNWLASPNLLVVGNYLSSRQDGANRWDQLLGGDGNFIAELNDLQLDLFYVRVERLSAGFFDGASATYSFNTQREERVNQGGNGDPNAAIAHEPERTTVNGVQFNASKQFSARQSLVVGGDFYFEGLTSESFNVDPVSGAVSPRRPRVPDGATYHQSGFFGQVSFDAVPDRLVLTGAARVGFNSYEAKASDAPVVSGQPLWPDDSLDTTSATFRVGAAWTPRSELTITTALSTGYRAPHMSDLGTLGLTGSGFEVAAPDLAGREAFVGSTADANAMSTGRPVEQVDSETSINVDVGGRYRVAKARVEAGVFVTRIDGNIQKQSLILPDGAVGTTIGGQPIVAQGPTGVVFVSLSTAPVLVRANFDKARIWGFEWLGEVDARPDLTIGSTFTYMRAVDTTTDLPPNIEGGTPAPGGTIWARYMKPGRHWWVQPYFVFAAEQPHLSTLDLGDRRTGASRSRANIQSFFRNGARARGWVTSGPDGIDNNADDVLIATGETLAQVQDRVLGVGVNSAPLFTAVKGYAAFGVRFGIRLGPHSIFVDAENLGDENYRGISWGMDAPGRGVSARYVYRF